LDFLIAHVLNGYNAIIGADFLYDEKFLKAITTKDLILSDSYQSETIPIFKSEECLNQINYVKLKETVHLPPDSSRSVKVDLLFSNTESDSDNILENHDTFYNLKSNNDLQYTMGPCELNNILATETSSILRNTSLEDLYLERDSLIATFSDSKESDSLELNSLKSEKSGDSKIPDIPESDHPHTSRNNEEESLEEKIIQENLLMDSTNLDKTFSYKDCEINSDLDPDLKSKLLKILETHQEVFAKSKLDVGKFKEFMVQLDIEGNIPHEKQRFISDEKQAFCDKTFLEFEKLGLIQECHTPKTVSNLHLVPKYEGLRDLTKASTYLAQVKGAKNTQFRIVQDLRRVNAATKNVKKSSPKLPEQIFQKLQGKIVSSIDANQAYWHLQLAPESRPHLCFYLKNRVMQFDRMAQGLTSAPACWDQAMEIIFSRKTMEKVKSIVGPEKASTLLEALKL